MGIATLKLIAKTINQMPVPSALSYLDRIWNGRWFQMQSRVFCYPCLPRFY